MSWRTIQLGSSLCDQDLLILSLFENKPVRYLGEDYFFSQKLLLDNDSTNLILIFNKPVWLSEIKKSICDSLSTPTNKIYLGINRYCIKGNDTYDNINCTNNLGNDIINYVGCYLKTFGIVEKNRGSFDHDSGKHFNFVQPITWFYGINESVTTQ